MIKSSLKIITGFLFLLTVTLSACGDAEWDSKDKNALLDRCQSEGGTKSYCKCYLENAMKEYPNAEDMDEIDFESAVELSLGCD